MESKRNNIPFKINKGYEEELERYRKLVVTNRESYLPKLAAALVNMGELSAIQCDTDVARKNYEEALTVYRELALLKRKIYLSQVAVMLSNIADLNIEVDSSKALCEYEEALVILREIMSWNVDSYLPLTVKIMINLSRYYLIYEKEREKSVYYAREALKLIEPVFEQMSIYRDYFIELIRILKTNGWKYY